MAAMLLSTSSPLERTALEPYESLHGLGLEAPAGSEAEGGAITSAARLLASVEGVALGSDARGAAPGLLLSAHAVHGAFAPAQIERVVRLAEAHVAVHGWLTKRHCNHPTTDFSLLDAPEVWAAAAPQVTAVVLPTLARLFFGDDEGAVLAINDLFYVRYDGDREGAQTSLEAHRDGSLVSFSIALTSPESFVGGGTRFVGADKVMRPTTSGDLVAHSGKIVHAGEPVTAGVRDILVGFVTVSGSRINQVGMQAHVVKKLPFASSGRNSRAISCSLSARLFWTRF